LLQVSLEAGSGHAKKLKADIAKLEGETYKALQDQECMLVGNSCFVEGTCILWQQLTPVILKQIADPSCLLVTWQLE
jgi:hypothetical protein